MSHFKFTAVAPAFEEMRTPYASGREICVHKLGNAYPQTRETNGAFQKYLYHHQTIQRNEMFANDARAFRDRLPHVLFETC